MPIDSVFMASLSLVLTKRLIGLLHGQLNVASRDGAGTTVTVTIG